MTNIRTETMPLDEGTFEYTKKCKVVGGEKGRGYLTGIQGAEGCFEFVSGWRRFRQFCNFFEDELRVVIGRGVRVRVVVEQPPCGFPKWIAELDSAVFEVRTMPTAPAVALCIFDGEQIAVAYEPTSRLAGGPDLWSRHTGLVAACRGYFDTLWSALR